MPLFRKKPVVIEAFRYNTNGPTPVPDWFNKALQFGDAIFQRPGPLSPIMITTLEGKMTAQPGDFIIRGVNGEIYPCKPDIFEKTYELVKEGE